MAENYFPEKPQPPKVNYFITPEEVANKVKESNQFIQDVAERYSWRNNASYRDTKQQVDMEGTVSVVPPSTNATTLSDNNIEDMYTKRLTAEEALSAFETYMDNMNVINTSTTATDVAENVILDPYNPKQDITAIRMAILREEFAKLTPDEGTVGTVSSVLGMMLREITIGTFENIFASKEARGRAAWDKVMSAKTMDEVRSASKELATYASDMGVLGQNSLIMSSELESAMNQGKGQYENLWAMFDIAGLGVGKLVGTAVKGGRIMTEATQSGLMATARDSVDVVKAAAPSMADETLAKAIANPETSAEIARHTSPAANKVAKVGEIDNVYPTVNPVLQFETTNNYLTALENAFKRTNTTEEGLKVATDNFLTNLTKDVSSHLLNFNRNYLGFDNYEMVVSLGRDDGKLFITKKSAEQFAANFVGSKVIPMADGYAVQVSQNLSLKNVGKATEASELRSFLFDMIASPEMTSSKDLNTLLKMGTSSIGRVTREITKTHGGLVRKLSKADNKTINYIIDDLRVGEDSYRRNWYTVEEFKDKFYAKTGRQANDNVVEAYLSYNKLNEAFWYIEADDLFKSAVNSKSFVGTFDGAKSYKLRAIETYEVPRGDVDRVLDLRTGKTVELNDIPKGTKVYQILDEGITVGDAVENYVIGDLKSSRRLFHTDVLGYQPGGSKTIDNANYFVIQDRLARNLSGKEFRTRAKTLVVARTAKEAEKSAKDINTILKAFRDSTGIVTGKFTKDALNSMDDLNNIIRANNGFNPSIETVDDFLKFMDDAGITADDVKLVNANDKVPDIGIGGLDYLQYGNPTTYRDIYKLNANPTAGTRDKIVYGYGGSKFKMLDPTRAIERDFARGVNYLAQRAYFKNAIEGLIKGGEKYSVNFADIKNDGMYQQLKRIKFDTTTKEGEAFAREQKTILARMNEKSEFAKSWERRMNAIGEKIFDKFNYDVFDKMSTDPTVALRGFAFDLKLGLFNIDQLIVQSSNAAIIISASPKFGTQAALSYLPMRAAMLNPYVLKTAAKRVSKLIGMSEEQFIEMMEYMKKSGRFEIDQTIQEINGSYDLGYGLIKRIRESGRVFFNEGERVARLMANNVAYREFRLKFPKLDITKEVNFRQMDEFITRRADALTMNMTSASAATWQKGLLSVPTQWMSYNARVIENLTFGRNFTTQEKIQIGLGQLAFYGSAAYGMGGYFNSFVDKSNVDLDPEVYTLMRYGVLDYILSTVTGVQTGIGGRLGVGEGLVDKIQELWDGRMVEALGGPSASIFTDTATAALSLIDSSINGNFDIAQVDLNKMLRNISTWDKGVRAKYIIQTGQYLSKSGIVLAENLSPEAALLNAFGAKLQAVDLQYEINDILADDKEMVREVAKRYKELKTNMHKAIQDEDLAAAKEFANEMGMLRAPLTPSQRRDLDRQTRSYFSSLTDSTIRRAYQNNRGNLARQLEKLQGTGANQ